MRLIDLDAKEPYLLDGRYSVDTVPKATILYSLDSFNKSVPSTELMESCNRARSLFEGKETHGHWEDVKVSDDGKLQSAKCSVCGRYETKPYLYWVRLSNYCPWCGAKMDVPDTNVGKMEVEE